MLLLSLSCAVCMGFSEQESAREGWHWHCPQCVIRMECERQTEALQRRRERLLRIKESVAPSSTKSSAKGSKKSGKAAAAAPAAASTAAAVSSADAALDVEVELVQLDATGAARVSS